MERTRALLAAEGGLVLISGGLKCRANEPASSAADRRYGEGLARTWYPGTRFAWRRGTPILSRNARDEYDSRPAASKYLHIVPFKRASRQYPVAGTVAGGSSGRPDRRGRGAVPCRRHPGAAFVFRGHGARTLPL